MFLEREIQVDDGEASQSAKQPPPSLIGPRDDVVRNEYKDLKQDLLGMKAQKINLRTFDISSYFVPSVKETFITSWKWFKPLQRGTAWNLRMYMSDLCQRIKVELTEHLLAPFPGDQAQLPQL